MSLGRRFEENRLEAMMVFSHIECTRIGRYSGGEKHQITMRHPIIQFLSNPYYEVSGIKFRNKDGVSCDYVNAAALPPRISKLGKSSIILV